MTKELDPSWEYYTPDPEIEEITTSQSECKIIDRMPYIGWHVTRLIKGCGKGNGERGTPTESYKTKNKKALLPDLWASSMTVAEIMIRLRTDLTTLTKWRKELGLLSRRKQPCSQR